MARAARTRNQRDYLLYAAFAALVTAAFLPLAHRLCPTLLEGLDRAGDTSPWGLAFIGSMLGGGIYTVADRMGPCGSSPRTAQDVARRQLRRHEAALQAVVCIPLFWPIWLIALCRYVFRAR